MRAIALLVICPLGLVALGMDSDQEARSHALNPTVCHLDQYDSITQEVEQPIPDWPGYLYIPSIKFPAQPSTVILDAVIGVTVQHPWAGQIGMGAVRTAQDGSTDFVRLLSYPTEPGGGDPCSGNLGSTYYFGLGGQKPLEALGCPTTFAGGCYSEDEASPGSFDLFVGDEKGAGTWELWIIDGEAGGVGFLSEWSVHLLCESSVFVESTSWSRVKASYR